MEKLFKSGYLCHPRQAYTLRRVTVSEGKDRGAQIIEIDTAGGRTWTCCRIRAWTSARCASGA
jgi:hypothetical protein